MMSLDRWDVALLAMGVYLAVVALVRMMIAHRDKLLIQLQAQEQLLQSQHRPTAGKVVPPGQAAARRPQEKAA